MRWLLKKIGKLLDWAFGLIWNVKATGYADMDRRAAGFMATPLMVIMIVALFLLIGGVVLLNKVPEYWHGVEVYDNRSEMTVSVEDGLQPESVRVDLKREGFQTIAVFANGQVIEPDFNRIGRNEFQVYYDGKLIGQFLQEKTDDVSRSEYHIDVKLMDDVVRAEARVEGAFEDIQFK